jgi:hypothetical protein
MQENGFAREQTGPHFPTNLPLAMEMKNTGKDYEEFGKNLQQAIINSPSYLQNRTKKKKKMEHNNEQEQ